MDPNAERQKIAQEFSLAAELAAAIPGATSEEVRANWDVINKFRPQAGALPTPPAPQAQGQQASPPPPTTALDVERLQKQLQGLADKFGDDNVKQALAQITGFAQEQAATSQRIAALELDKHRASLALKHGLTDETAAQLPGATPEELDASLKFALQLRGPAKSAQAQPGVAPPAQTPPAPPVRLATPAQNTGGTPQNQTDRILSQFKQQVSEFASQQHS